MTEEKQGWLDSNAGVLRGQWKNQKGKTEVICFGTGFAISPHIVLTCAHSIYLEKRKRLCTAFTFIPGIHKGKITSTQSIYRCTPLNFIQYEPLKDGESYTKHPIEEDIALLYLQRPLNLKQYPRVGVEEKEFIDIQQEVFISGYPSSQFYKCVNIFDAFFEKVNLQGRILEINESVIYHNLRTNVGHSGSAIISPGIYEEPVVLGVHTHKGSKRNSGVFLTKKILERLINYQINFALQHEEYKLSIKFPTQLRSSILNELDGQTLQKILTFQQYSQRKIMIPQPNSLDIANPLANSLDQYQNSNGSVSLVNKIKNFLEVTEKYFEQIKAPSVSNEILAIYLRINKLFLDWLRPLYEQSKATQQIIIDYTSQYSLRLTNLGKGLENQLISLRQYGKSISKTHQLKFSTVEEHLNKYSAAIKMKDQTHSHEERMQEQEKKDEEYYNDQNWDQYYVIQEFINGIQAYLIRTDLRHASISVVLLGDINQSNRKLRNQGLILGSNFQVVFQRPYKVIEEWNEHFSPPRTNCI